MNKPVVSDQAYNRPHNNIVHVAFKALVLVQKQKLTLLFLIPHLYKMLQRLESSMQSCQPRRLENTLFL